jgi:dTDP-4-dehydrorhamnose 3,5-epimerase
MKFEPTDLPGVVLIEPTVHSDDRGFFLEVYHRGKFERGGINETFVQDNRACSVRGTLRGLHAQVRKPQGKLVTVTRGEIFDVAVDIRRGSPTFGRWFGTTLTASSFRMLYIPAGFAHGYCVVSDEAEVTYKCTALYDPEGEIAIAWNDPTIGVRWPVNAPLLSEKDRLAPRLADLENLPRFDPER